jgi:hypothetical protein
MRGQEAQEASFIAAKKAGTAAAQVALMTQESTESSVLFSLAELQQMEHERIETEEHQRLVARERERERREAEAERIRAAQTQLASERVATEERARRIAENEARERAREACAVEVSRIEAEAKVRLAAEERARTHELALLRVRAHTQLYRLCVGLGVTLSVVLCLAAVGAWRAMSELDRLQQDASQARQERDAIALARDGVAKELARAHKTWRDRVEVLETKLNACEVQARQHTPNGPPNGTPPKPPPSERNTLPRPCKFEGDPMCDASGQPG